jgi:phage replication-related protein YjqB (UPF0714/DUF867 family)
MSDHSSTTITIDSDPQMDRRGFMRILGMMSIPIAAQGCSNEESETLDSQSFRALNPPASIAVSVLQAKSSQSVASRAEQLSISAGLGVTLGLGDQCRVLRSGGSFAIYTVGEVQKEPGKDKLRMGLEARARLGTTSTFTGTLQTRVVADLTDAQAEAQSEFVERLIDDGSNTGLIAIAPHGGNIEPHTDEQAALVRSLLAGKGASSWICKGYKQGGGAYDRWHITSTDISRRSFPGLDAVADRNFAYAVSFHGMSHEVVLIGGAAPYELKQLIQSAIIAKLEGSDIEVSIASSTDNYSGDSPENLVNWLTAGGQGGVQIEQSMRARNLYGLDIATAVASVFDQLL